MYEIKPFNKEHLEQLEVVPEAREIVNRIEHNGPAFSAFADNEIFAIAGINMFWPGVGEAWVIFGTSYLKHGFFIHRTTIRYLKQLAADLNLERLQAVVLKDHYAGIEWMDRLGFQYEGDMEKYFGGKTFLRYAKIYEGDK